MKPNKLVIGFIAIFMISNMIYSYIKDVNSDKYQKVKSKILKSPKSIELFGQKPMLILVGHKISNNTNYDSSLKITNSFSNEEFKFYVLGKEFKYLIVKLKNEKIIEILVSIDKKNINLLDN